MNAYFQVIYEDTGAFIKLFAPTEGGSLLEVKEVTTYLDKEGVTYDLKSLNDEILSLSVDKKVALPAQKAQAIPERFSSKFSPNNMEVTLRFYPPSTGGRSYTMEDIESELRVQKVQFGVQEDVLDAFLKERKYCTDYVAVKGQPIVEGSDAVITYHFPTDTKVHPTLNEDGSVDFFNLNVLHQVGEGDLLASLEPEVRGQEGKDVLGNILKPREVKRATLQYGLNISINEEKTAIFSQVNGHVSLYNGKVFVSNVYEVENVDNSTGNITYEGSVRVNGNVNANFVIKAKGDVEVKGVVEGATIIAGGNIIIQKGIKGMGRGNIAAKGNIIAKFIENCMVVSERSIIVDSIMHSTVTAEDEIIVENSKGFIIGGKTTARNLVKVKNLGSTMGADTKINVGVSPEVFKRVTQLQDRSEALQKSMEKAQPAIDGVKEKVSKGMKLLPEQIAKFQELVAGVKEQQEEIKKNAEEIESIKRMVEAATNSQVQVMGTANPGVIIQISDVSMLIKQPFKYCKFVRESGSVKMRPL
ncbi:MAG: FapA family protein [Lachnospiraceae bacterium]|nr:FapA family protein [Lachnospiraceae bacterium]